MFIKDIVDYFRIKYSGLFDTQYYARENQNARNLRINQIWHFVKFGWKEQRNPSKDFDVSYYLEQNPDVKASGLNPLIHYIRHGKAEGRQPIPDYTNEMSKFIKINDQEKVTVIIPTKNAGEGFKDLIEGLKNQKGFSNLEIVIVDSGSKDRTVKLAKRYKAKVVKIPPKDFSHSYARNLGAKKASGDYLLFTVQDALPPNNTWLNTLMTRLKELNVSAVSCAERPRDDADLFYRVICWNHYEFLDVNHSDRIFTMPSEPNYFNLRKNGQLSDLACLIPADLFAKYQYRYSYAEDLDLGLRLIKDGHKLAFLSSPRIIHSHNRPAYYFIKRGFVDHLTLSKIFNDFYIPEFDFTEVAHDIAFIYHYIRSYIFMKIDEFAYPIDLDEFRKRMFQMVDSATTYCYPQTSSIFNNQSNNPELMIFMKRLLEHSGYKKTGVLYDGNLSGSIREFLHSTFQYLEVSHITIDKNLANELKPCLLKGAANIFGASLAYAYLNQSDTDKKKFSSIYSMLKEDV